MLYNIGRIRPLLTQKAAQVLLQALVISHLGDCNSLLAGLPVSTIQPLQLIQNAAARLVFNLNLLTLLCSSAPFTGYQWLPASVSKHEYLRTVLRTDRVQSTSRTWLNVTPQSVHAAVLIYVQQAFKVTVINFCLKSRCFSKYRSISNLPFISKIIEKSCC